jgi:RNA-binding protein
MNPLSPTERRALRAKAHHLEPVVIVGHHGLTPAVLHEIDLALLAHDLVKVRVLGDDREARAAMLTQVCATLDCAAVQQVGKVLVLWRPNPERKKKAPKEAEPAKPARARKQSKKPAKVDVVRERRRRKQADDAMSGGRQRRGAGRVAPPSPPAEGEPRTRRRTRS